MKALIKSWLTTLCALVPLTIPGLAFAATLPPLPVTSISALGPSAAQVGGGICKNGIEVVEVAFRLDETMYRLYLADNGAFVLVDQRDGDETPIWFGTVHHQTGAMRLVETIRFKDLKDPSLCQNLARLGKQAT